MSQIVAEGVRRKSECWGSERMAEFEDGSV